MGYSTCMELNDQNDFENHIGHNDHVVVNAGGVGDGNNDVGGLLGCIHIHSHVTTNLLAAAAC